MGQGWRRLDDWRRKRRHGDASISHRHAESSRAEPRPHRTLPADAPRRDASIRRVHSPTLGHSAHAHVVLIDRPWIFLPVHFSFLYTTFTFQPFEPDFNCTRAIFFEISNSRKGRIQKGNIPPEISLRDGLKKFLRICGKFSPLKFHET